MSSGNATEQITPLEGAGIRSETAPAPSRHKLRLVPLLEVRQNVPETQRLACYAASLAVAAAISFALLALSGVAPSDVMREIATVAFSSPRALGSVLAQTAPLVMAGLATAIAFRSNFWNIGLEGQMILGAIFASVVAIYDVGPEPARLVLMAVAAMAGGMLWVSVPAMLKQRLGVSEVITTLLLNYVAFNLLLHLLYGPWKDPVSSFPHTEQYEAFERLPLLGWLNLTWTLPLAALLAGLLWWLLSYSRIGYLLDMTSSNREMARAVGVPVAGLTVAAILASGAVGGLTGFSIAAGVEFRMTQDFFAGYLFSGVLIAFLGRNHPAGVVIVAFFMAILLLVGQSLQIFFQVPSALVQLVQAIFIICVAASEFFLTYRMHWRAAT
ncbi:ABC transporter permease [Roseibium aggregatum]|uniref:ABC transporter permease n=1 Tax=Roseibium aggregatum TaxID=187304 RepID=A0A939EBK1_9HYPH|nr:ABC transporter permease [Roseibium aggregatum]MBN9669726.1 ABC transporter permease [Roseibium aggregatum]